MPRKRKTDRVEVFRKMRIPVTVIASSETVRNCLAIIEQLIPHMREDQTALINLGDDLDKIKQDILEQLELFLTEESTTATTTNKSSQS